MKHGLLQSDIVLGNTLADMYAKCIALLRARKKAWMISLFGMLSLGLRDDGIFGNVLSSMYASAFMRA